MFSGILILIGTIAFIKKGGITTGIDFKGGNAVNISGKCVKWLVENGKKFNWDKKQINSWFENAVIGLPDPFASREFGKKEKITDDEVREIQKEMSELWIKPKKGEKNTNERTKQESMQILMEKYKRGYWSIDRILKRVL